MKQLSLHDPRHKVLETAFSEWLKLTGYAGTSVYSIPNHIRELLHYLEQQNKALTALTAQDLHTYFFHLKARRKQRSPGALSTNYLHKHRQAVKLFSRYLRETDQAYIDVDIQLPGQTRKMQDILTKKEIRELYNACEPTPVGIRDRAMLAVFYGCGLRRKEGVNLDITDYNEEKSLLYVRQGKRRERYVPLTQTIKGELSNYLTYARPQWEGANTTPAFFISKTGHRLQGQSHMVRFKQLQKKAGIDKNAGLHSLRHSIATHLLEGEMPLKQIALFLGHRSLESTQIYTHILHEI